MGLGIRRDEPSCFCNFGCPAGTFPFRQYWVTTPALPGPNYNDNHYLFRNDTQSPPVCTWKAVRDHFIGPSIENFTLELILNDPDLMGYQIELILLDPGGINTWRNQFFTALPEPQGEVQPESPTSCSRMTIQLPHVIFGLSSIATLTPAYPDACDDDDFPEKQQTKFLAAF